MNNRSNELKFLAKHSAIYGVGNVLSKAVAFILLPLYTRFLTPSDYGVLELIDVTSGLVGIVVGLGVTSALSRFYYEFQEESDRCRLVSTVYVLVGVAAAILVFLMNLAAPTLAVYVLNGEKFAWYFRMAFANLLVGVFIDVGQSYLRMLYKSVLFMGLSIISLIVGVSLNVFFIVHLHEGVLGILYGNLITKLIVVGPLTAAILYRIGIGFSWRDAKKLLTYSLPLLPSSVATALMNYSDRYFIKGFVSIADAGVYGLANKIGGALHMLVTTPFIMTFMPRRFQIAHEQPNAREIFTNVFDGFFFVLLFLSLVLAVFTTEIMVIMTTPGFYGAGALVPLILVNMLIFGMKYHVDFGILYSRKTQYYMYVNMVTSVVQLTAAFLLVRSFGMWGAVYASLISVSVNATLLYVVSARLYDIPFNIGRSAKLLACASIVYFLSRYVVTSHIALTIAIKCLLIAGFVAVLPLMNLVSDAEVSELRAIGRSLFRTPQVQEV